MTMKRCSSHDAQRHVLAFQQQRYEDVVEALAFDLISTSRAIQSKKRSRPIYYRVRGRRRRLAFNRVDTRCERSGETRVNVLFVLSGFEAAPKLSHDHLSINAMCVGNRTSPLAHPKKFVKSCVTVDCHLRLCKLPKKRSRSIWFRLRGRRR